MTDPIPNSEINADLALAMGWTTHKYSPIHDGVVWHSPVDNDDPVEIFPPDFCGDWKYAGPLFAEMWEKALDSEGHVGDLVDEVLKIQVELSCELEEAIARADHATLKARQ